MMLGRSSGSAEEHSATQLVGSGTGVVEEGSSREAKAVDIIPSLGFTTFLSFACAGNVQKTAKPVEKARRMILLVVIN